MEAADFQIQADLRAKDINKQFQAILQLIQWTATGKDVQCYFLQLIECLGKSKNSNIRKCIYQLLKNCYAHDDDWLPVAEALLADLQEEDPEICVAAVRALNILPRVIFARTLL